MSLFLKVLYMNKGSTGTNPTYDRNQGNRGDQLNPKTPKNGKK